MGNSFTILIDTREQYPWSFTKDISTHKCTLQTADYSVVSNMKDLQDKYTDEDLDYLLCIERKKNPAEFAGNVTSASFKRELQRMSVYRHKYILFECDFSDFLTFPVGSSIPKRRWKTLRVRGPFMISSLTSMSIRYNIHFVFCGDADNASYIATELIKKVYKTYMEQ